MNRQKMLFIYNPHAGKAQIRSNLLDMIDIFTKAGYEVTTYPTQMQGDAQSVFHRDMDAYEMIVCSGGDGTLDEVVTGMMETGVQIPLGYIPAGTTNDFAKSLHIPRNMIKAANSVVNGRDYYCDVGSFNNDIFVYIAAFGLFTDVSYETDQELKNNLGHLAYVLKGINKLSTIESFPMAISYDGITIEGEFIFGMITNSLSVGGFKAMGCQEVDLDDGLFEATFIKKPETLNEMNKIILFLLGNCVSDPCIINIKVSNLKIKALYSIPWTLDGEFGGNHSQVTIDNHKKALCIRVPEV